MPEGTSYTIRFSEQAKADLKHVDRVMSKRITARLKWLGENASVVQHSALTGQWKGLYRLRVGDYRILYRVRHDLRLIRIELIDHRSRVYD